jgi:hypothetical protein
VEKVLVEEVASASTGADAAALPERVQEALGELAGAAKEGLLALSVDADATSSTSTFSTAVPPVRSSGRGASTTRIVSPSATGTRPAR